MMWVFIHFFQSDQSNWQPQQPFPKQALDFVCLQYKSLENTLGQGEIACDALFLLSPPVFSTLLTFLSNLKLLPENSFSLEESKTCRLGKG